MDLTLKGSFGNYTPEIIEQIIKVTLVFNINNNKGLKTL